MDRPLLCGATVIMWSDRHCVERPLLCGATVIMWSDRYCVERPLLWGATYYGKEIKGYTTHTFIIRKFEKCRSEVDQVTSSKIRLRAQTRGHRFGM